MHRCDETPRQAQFAVGLGMNQRNNDIGQKSLKSTVFGASANIGPGTLSALQATLQGCDRASHLVQQLLTLSRLPVVGALGLVGIISRVDVLREIIRDDEAPAPDA